MKDKLTVWQWEALLGEYNLSDGHSRQNQNKKQQDIVAHLASTYLLSEQEKQSKIQEDFKKAFFTTAGQKSYTLFSDPLYFYSCSLAIETVANYLRLQKKSVTLLHPTFDNLADILKRHNLNPVAIEEEQVLKLIHNRYEITTDALFLVCPNNPTGFELTKEQFRKIVKYCRKKNILLILDFSFRFFSKDVSWDQYKILYGEGINFISLEDTGKTWPTLDLKLGILLSNEDIYPKLQDISNDLLLNVSPFIFKLITEYIRLEKSYPLKLSIVKIIEKNRSTLIRALRNTKFQFTNSHSTISVAWIKLPQMWKAIKFCKWLEDKNLFVLPGVPFYWNNPNEGEQYIRIALARSPQLFNLAAKKLRKCILEYKSDR